MRFQLFGIKERNLDWHQWFAWRPVFCGRDAVSVVWLETIWRKKEVNIRDGDWFHIYSFNKPK